MDNGALQMGGILSALLQDPSAQQGVDYVNREFARIPEGKRFPDVNEKTAYGGGFVPYIQKMLSYGDDKYNPEGENVVQAINSIFGSGSHKTFYKALEQMSPEQQAAFAQFIGRFGQVTDPLRERSLGDQVRQAIDQPNVITRAAGRMFK